MSQFQNQTQSPTNRRIGDDGSVQCKHGKAPLLTSTTSQSRGRKFFTCPLNREDKNKCKLFAWLDDIRHDEDWNETRFRVAYGLPPEDTSTDRSAGTPRKRRIAQDSVLSPSSPPKRIKPDEDHYLSDEDFFTSLPTNHLHSTPSRTHASGDMESRTAWPVTPSSSQTRHSQTLVADSSPSQDSVRRRETRVVNQSPYLRNFESASDLSALSLTPGSREAQMRIASADEIEDMFSTTGKFTLDYVRKLERRSIATQKASDAKAVRIQQLEAEMEVSQRHINNLNREMERFQQEIHKLTRENDRLTRENDRLSRVQSE